MRRSISKLFLYLFTFMLIVWIALPLYLMIKVSISTPAEILKSHPALGIGEPTLKHWQQVLAGRQLIRPLSKSLAVATLSAGITLLIAIPGAYGISRLPARWQYAALLLIFFTRMFPEVGIGLGISVLFIRLNLIDTNIGLALAHVIKVLPIACWILIGVFRTIPPDLEEQAQVDGASRLETLKTIVLPLSGGGVAVAAIFAWLFSWDEFTYALYLCLSKPTLPLQVYYYINRGSWFLTATYATIITVPVVLVTYSLQRFLKAGYTAGAIKG